MSTFTRNYQSLREKLKNEGNYTVLDKEVHIKAVAEMNESLEEVRREFQIKDRESNRNAEYVILTD